MRDDAARRRYPLPRARSSPDPSGLALRRRERRRASEEVESAVAWPLAWWGASRRVCLRETAHLVPPPKLILNVGMTVDRFPRDSFGLSEQVPRGERLCRPARRAATRSSCA